MTDISITVCAFANLRSILGARTNVILSQGQAVRDLLEILSENHRCLREIVFDPEGRLNEGIEILINGRIIEQDKEFTTKLQDGDQVFLFPTLLGG
jgi:MoaD family protein